MKLFTKVATLFSIIVTGLRLCSPAAELTSSQPDVSPWEVTDEVLNSQSDHPFLRHRRDVNCTIPQYLPQLVRELNTFMSNESTFIGVPLQPANATRPANQPKLGDCPGPTGSWWPGATDSLKSTCPWVYVSRDLGATFYPRYILDVECLCPTCIHSGTLSCNKLRTDIMVFKRGECRDGLAVMTAVKERVTSACVCVGAGKTTAASGTE